MGVSKSNDIPILKDTDTIDRHIYDMDFLRSRIHELDSINR